MLKKIRKILSIVKSVRLKSEKEHKWHLLTFSKMKKMFNLSFYTQVNSKSKEAKKKVHLSTEI